MKTSESGESDTDDGWIVRVRAHLMDWYRCGHRALPWRQDRDPYKILVSELMLVQTTVAAVVPFFGRFLERFPTVQALADANEADVLKAWEGLGYYRRARQLHAAAREIVRDHGGVVPDDPARLLELPGVGRYIAGAVASIAFDRPVPIVEANTQRVLARWLAWPEDVRTAASQARFWLAAARLVPPRDAGLFNQAFMELGATICSVREPSCLVCPVASECRARAEGLQDRLPSVAPRPKPIEVLEACGLVVRQGRLLMVRRGAGTLWADFWEFPTIHIAGADPAARGLGLPGAVGLAEGLRRLTGVRVEVGSPVHTIRFGVTKHRVTLTAHAARGLEEATSPGPGLTGAAWVAPEEIRGLTLGSAQRRLASWALQPANRINLAL